MDNDAPLTIVTEALHQCSGKRAVAFYDPQTKYYWEFWSRSLSATFLVRTGQHLSQVACNTCGEFYYWLDILNGENITEFNEVDVIWDELLANPLSYIIRASL